MKINGVEYKNVPITFNVLCQLESLGVSITDMESHLMSAARAYASICMKKSVDAVGEIIEQHVINGGSVKDIIAPFAEEVEKSDFFQKMLARAKDQQEEQTEA